MFNNFYKVLAVQFPFLLCSSILGSIQSVSGPTHSSDSLLEDRQRGQSGYPLGCEGSWYRDWGNQRKAEQEVHTAKGERGGRRREWGWRHGGRRGPQRAESSRLGHSVLIGKLAQFSELLSLPTDSGLGKFLSWGAMYLFLPGAVGVSLAHNQDWLISRLEMCK